MNDDFKYIVAIAEHRSINKAAYAMHISQPALSQRLKRLEAKLGTKLFERTTASLRPTPTGEVVVHYAKRAVDAGNVLRYIRRHDAPLSQEEERFMGIVRAWITSQAL